MDYASRLMTAPIFWWMAIASGTVFVASLVAVPWIIVRLPADYFDHQRRVTSDLGGKSAAALRLLKNVSGALFIAMGLAMLVLPGQGFLTIFIGLTLIDFPGKYRLERHLVTRKFILTPMNWVRHKSGKPHFQISSAESQGIVRK